jgi:hypothetical protein
MGYLVQCYNHGAGEWETLPYYTEDGQEHTTYPIEHMAKAAMQAYDEQWDGDYRVISCGGDDK